LNREKAEDQKVVEFQRIARDDGGQLPFAQLCCHAYPHARAQHGANPPKIITCYVMYFI